MTNQFSKADIEKARARYWLKEAQRKLGNEVKSLDNITFERNDNKPFMPLGERLQKIADNREGKILKSYKGFKGFGR